MTEGAAPVDGCLRLGELTVARLHERNSSG